MHKRTSMHKRAFHYGWVIVALGFLALAVSMGTRAAFGVYVLPWEEDFGQSRSQIVLISFVSLVVYGAGNLFVGRLSEKWGVRAVFSISVLLLGLSLVAAALSTAYWQVMLAYGLLASFGFSGASNVTASIAVARWFTDERRAFLLALMVAGMGIGQMLLVPLQVLLVAKYSWRATLLGIGLVYALVVAPILAAFLRSDPRDVGLSPLGASGGGGLVRGSGAASAAGSQGGAADRGGSNAPDRPNALGGSNVPAGPTNPRSAGQPEERGFGALLRSVYFWILFATFFVCGFTDLGIVDNHLVPFAQGRGLDEASVAAIITVLSVGSLVGVVIVGYLADRLNRAYLLAALFLVRTVAFLFVFGIGKGLATFLFPVLLGMTAHASIAPMNTHAISLFGRYSIGYVVGIMSLGHQLGAAAGAYIPGLLFDLTGAYEPSFFAALLIAALNVLLIPWVTARQRARDAALFSPPVASVPRS